MLLGSIILPVIRPSAPGQYVKGHWVDADAAPPFNITCSVQPIGGARLQVLMQGHRINTAVEIITETELRATDPKTQTTGDIVQYAGYDWQVVEVNAWKNGLINHYECVIGRLKEGT